MNTIEWKPVQDALLSLLVGALTVCLPFLARQGVRWLKLKAAQIEATIAQQLDDRQMALVRYAVGLAVRAAEQIYSDKSQAGKDKLDYAVKFATDWLESRGVRVPIAQLVAEAEAAVLDEFNRGKPEIAPPDSAA